MPVDDHHTHPVGQASSLLVNPVKLSLQTPSLRIRRRQLPHWQMDGAVYFITFNSWEKLELTPTARQVVLDACLFFHLQRYELFSIVVMPDHVHLLMQPWAKSSNEFWSLSSILHSLKSYSAKQIPKVMPHIGTVWQPDWYDRIIRNHQEFQNTWEYIQQNPVKAKLSSVPEDYSFLWNSDKFGE
jgi:putative transposase